MHPDWLQTANPSRDLSATSLIYPPFSDRAFKGSYQFRTNSQLGLPT